MSSIMSSQYANQYVHTTAQGRDSGELKGDYISISVNEEVSKVEITPGSRLEITGSDVARSDALKKTATKAVGVIVLGGSLLALAAPYFPTGSNVSEDSENIARFIENNSNILMTVGASSAAVAAMVATNSTEKVITITSKSTCVAFSAVSNTFSFINRNVFTPVVKGSFFAASHLTSKLFALGGRTVEKLPAAGKHSLAGLAKVVEGSAIGVGVVAEGIREISVEYPHATGAVVGSIILLSIAANYPL